MRIMPAKRGSCPYAIYSLRYWNHKILLKGVMGMGKLRVVPKTKTMDPDKYNELRKMLHEAEQMAQGHKVFYDLDEKENRLQARRDLLYVAERESMDVFVRSIRNSNALEIIFKMGRQALKRISAEQYRSKVLDVLKTTERPLKKREILSQAGLAVASWNVLIKELLNDGAVIREGKKGEAVYLAAS